MFLLWPFQSDELCAHKVYRHFVPTARVSNEARISPFACRRHNFHLFQLNAFGHDTKLGPVLPANLKLRRWSSKKTHVNTPQLISLTPIIQSFHFHQLQNFSPSVRVSGSGKTLLCSLRSRQTHVGEEVILQFPALRFGVLTEYYSTVFPEQSKRFRDLSRHFSVTQASTAAAALKPHFMAS